MQDFIDFLKEEINTATGALNAYYDQIADFSQTAQQAYENKDSVKVRMKVVSQLNKAVADAEYEEATLNIYTVTLSRLEAHIKNNTVDDFIETLLKSLSREIGSKKFSDNQLSQKDRAYADANFSMFKNIIPYVGYAGN